MLGTAGPLIARKVGRPHFSTNPRVYPQNYSTRHTPWQIHPSGSPKSAVYPKTPHFGWTLSTESGTMTRGAVCGHGAESGSRTTPMPPPQTSPLKTDEARVTCKASHEHRKRPMGPRCGRLDQPFPCYCPAKLPSVPGYPTSARTPGPATFEFHS